MKSALPKWGEHVAEITNGQHDGLTTPSLMTERVLSDARRAFEGADPATLRRCTEQAVASLWHDTVKVRTFIPVLALRHIRDMLDQSEPSRAEHNGGA